MNYRHLGGTGLRVSELCLGTMTFGWGTDEPLSHRMLDRFVDLGGNFIDTADIYAEGESETIIGRWLNGQSRDGLVIAGREQVILRNPDGLARIVEAGPE